MSNAYYEQLYTSEVRLEVGELYRPHPYVISRQWSKVDPGLRQRWAGGRSPLFLVLDETLAPADAYPDTARSSSYRYRILCGGEEDTLLLFIGMTMRDQRAFAPFEKL